MAKRLEQLAGIPVAHLKGVGAKTQRGLEVIGVHTVLDLLTYYPRRYLDRTKEARIRELRPGEEAVVLVEVQKTVARRSRTGKVLVTAEVSDGSSSLRLTFFNQPWRERQLRKGMSALVFGKLEIFQGWRQMTNPVVDLVGDKTRRIIPVYPQSEKAGIMTWDIAKLMEEVLDRVGSFAEPVDPAVLRRFGFVDRTTAFFDIHRPESMAAVQEARRRLVFDELLRVQLELVRRKRELERTTVGIRHDAMGLLGAEGLPGRDFLVGRFHERLPFPLTRAQHRAIREIAADMAGPHPMHRLLQGDVGAGKTIVAVTAMLVAVQSGHQAALMAPTEVLAEQHYLGMKDMLTGLTVPDTADGTLFADQAIERELNVALLTNRTSASERRRLLIGLADGSVDLVIGTHALIQEGIEFRSLGLVVIDEQHRFGVEQRAALRQKSAGVAVPDVLVMTATPIPRTAAMTVYGDLDVSVLDELPPGRTPIETRWVRSEAEQHDMWRHVRSEISAGRQAYVVTPLIEESDRLQVASAEETFARLTGDGGELCGLKVGLLHGRVSPAEKEQTMSLFRSGALDVLIATTVIEVGVDVPNATVMVILDADRFGIAQLHQLRGRVGRGGHRSYCYVVADPAGDDGELRASAVARLEAMVKTTDGFELAEIDLDLRGEGTIMGERQKGRNDLKLASLRRDREWVAKAREVAFEILDADPMLERHPMLAAEIDVLLGDEQAAEFLLKS
ncbi:MAG: ATP-dependent DNA helicase RecG [Acidimicrobiales bacterium]|nr:ATP-dependent DNA helicase RecG [Acidimicrobiales bacterium]